MFYRFKPANIDGTRKGAIDDWIRTLSRPRFHDIVWMKGLFAPREGLGTECSSR
jgi:hypothetical protein